MGANIYVCRVGDFDPELHTLKMVDGGGRGVVGELWMTTLNSCIQRRKVRIFALSNLYFCCICLLKVLGDHFLVKFMLCYVMLLIMHFDVYNLFHKRIWNKNKVIIIGGGVTDRNFGNNFPPP